MKLNSATYVWGFTAVFILVAGCISLGNGNGPAATPQGQAATVITNTGSLTDAQKTQAANIAKDDPSAGKILAMPGYSVTGVYRGGSGNALTAVVFIEGGSTAHSDGSIWTPDIYQVTVDLTGNKVTAIDHLPQKALPTPPAAH